MFQIFNQRETGRDAQDGGMAQQESVGRKCFKINAQIVHFAHRYESAKWSADVIRFHGFFHATAQFLDGSGEWCSHIYLIQTGAIKMAVERK